MEQGRPEDLFELLEQLGKGSYGAVYKARHRPSGTVVAVKVIPLTGEDEEGLEDIRREIAVLQECVHPNVVRYFGSFMGDEYLGSSWSTAAAAACATSSPPAARL